MSNIYMSVFWNCSSESKKDNVSVTASGEIVHSACSYRRYFKLPVAGQNSRQSRKNHHHK